MAETTTDPKLVKAGKPEAGDFKAASTKKKEPDDTENANAGAAGDGNAGDGNNDSLTEDQLKKLTDDQLLSVLKDKGIELPEGGLDQIKERLNGKKVEPKVEPTAEEKAAAEKAAEKRMLDYFVEHGGTPEGFVALKQVAAADLRALSESEIRRELKEAEFSDEEVEFILKERYYQINPDELEQMESESEEDFEKRKDIAKRKAKFGLKKLESKASYTKKQAEEALNELRNAIQVEELLVQQEAEFKSGIDGFAKSFPRKLTFQLGEFNNEKLEPVEFDVTEADITEALSVLADPAQRKQYFFKEGNSFNLENVGNLLIRNKILENAIKAGYLEGGNKQVEIFEQAFPGRRASDVGVGGKDNRSGGSGTIVKAGKPEAGDPTAKTKV